MRALLPEPPAEPAGGAGEVLSGRELAVLELIAQGLSNQEISERLFISLHTVKSHARHINDKLGVERRTQAVARAKHMGLLRQARHPMCLACWLRASSVAGAGRCRPR